MTASHSGDKLIIRDATSSDHRVNDGDAPEGTMWSFDEMLGHKKKSNGSVTAKIKWSNGDVTWEPLDNAVSGR